ncbi:MAG: electron transport complex subunit RsxA [Pseudomonadaceae bacterium]|nr:electron transport complex subunit RsxA [Pseudomonadaceae bacterium]
MNELLLLLLATAFVNNFVLAQFLGLCPFVGTSGRFDTATSMGLATAFVLTFAALLSYAVYHSVLLPLDLAYLRIIAFIVIIAATVQATEMLLRSISPILHTAMGLYLPLITSNCAVLALALLAVDAQLSLLQTVVYALGASLGFSIVLALFAAARERTEQADAPAAFAGVPLALVTAGIMSLAFMGFKGMGT